MTAVPLRQIPTDATHHPRADNVITILPHAPGEVRLVPPGPLPEDAVVLGHVVAVPGRQLSAVPDAGPAGVGGLADLVLDPLGRRVVADGRELDLTRREFELLAYLVDHPGRVFTRTQLLAAVWQESAPRRAPVRTVDVHVSRVRRKLGRHAAMLQSLRGVGYRWSSRPGNAF